MPELSDSIITPYSIRVGGIRPEAGYGYHYTDSKHDFLFYIHIKLPPEEDEPTIYVHTAAGMFEATLLEQIEIERNIRDHFRRFDIFERPASASNPPSRLRFTWKLQW